MYDNYVVMILKKSCTSSSFITSEIFVSSFATGCLVSPDGDSISCDCKEGYFGARCQSCAAGYYGRPEVQGKQSIYLMLPINQGKKYLCFIFTLKHFFSHR